MRRAFGIVLLLAVIAGVASWFLVPEPWARALLAAEYLRNGVARKTLTVAGERWSYLEGGQGDPVLLVHGFGGDGDNFVRFAGPLTGQYRVLAPDLPGFGQSDRAQDGKYSIEAQAERVRGFARALGLERYHLGGNSMGGAIAAWIAHRYPGEVESVLLLEPFGLGNLPDVEVDRLVARGELPLVARTVEEHDRLRRVVFTEEPWIPRPILVGRRALAIARADHLEKIWREFHAEEGFLDELLPKIAPPALVIWGDTSQVFHVSGAERMGKRMPNVKVLVVKPCGHVPQLERPAETAEAYVKFLSAL